MQIKVDTKCDFCREFSGNVKNTFSRLYGVTLPHRQLFQSNNFCVVPSLGQLHEGHLLIVPAEHHTAMADLSPKEMDELLALQEVVRTILEGAYGPCIWFEHGTRAVSAGGCGIYHAHLHAVPFARGTELVSELVQTYPYAQVASIADGVKISKEKSYLYVEKTDRGAYFFEVEYLPSQYMRKLVARFANTRDWDWRNAGIESHLISTLTRLSTDFHSIHLQQL